MSAKAHLSSIKSSQLRIFILSFALPSFLILAFFFSFSIRRADHLSIQEKVNTLNLLSSKLSSEITPAVQMSLIYVYDEDTLAFYRFLQRSEMESDLVSYNQVLFPYTKSVSKNMTLLGKNMEGIGFYPSAHNEGRYFYLPRYKSMTVYESCGPETKDWFSPLKDKDTDVIFTLNPDSENVLSIIRTAKDIDRKTLYGYVSVDVSLGFIPRLLNELSIAENSGLVLFSPSGELLYSTNPSLGSAKALTLARREGFSSMRGKYHVYGRREENWGFHIYYLASKSDLYRDYLSAFFAALLFYCVIFLFTGVVYFHHIKKINGSIAPIIRTMTQYRGGDLHIRCDTGQCAISEFHMISENLNEMIGNINEHINKEYKLQMEQKTAEFQALQSEVNPHFLYNMLNLFVSLNRVGERAQLENAILRLSHLFRYTCESQTASSIREEFAFIEDYLSLQEIRYEERLSFQIYIEPELENFQIPKLLIQPLVENAIVHSLEPSDADVSIQLSCSTMETKNGERFAVISVVNTGAPFSRRETGRKSVGLDNVRERLHIFNANALFFISGGEGKPTKCYLMIPLETL